MSSSNIYHAFHIVSDKLLNGLFTSSFSLKLFYHYRQHNFHPISSIHDPIKIYSLNKSIYDLQRKKKCKKYLHQYFSLIFFINYSRCVRRYLFFSFTLLDTQRENFDDHLKKNISFIFYTYFLSAITFSFSHDQLIPEESSKTRQIVHCCSS